MVHIRLVVRVHRGVVAGPENVGLGAGFGWIGGEAEFIGSETGLEEFVQAGFEDRGRALFQSGYD